MENLKIPTEQGHWQEHGDGIDIGSSKALTNPTKLNEVIKQYFASSQTTRLIFLCVFLFLGVGKHFLKLGL